MSRHDSTDAKSDVKAWLLHLLADVEVCVDVEATRTETAGRCVTIILQFKSKEVKG